MQHNRQNEGQALTPREQRKLKARRRSSGPSSTNHILSVANANGGNAELPQSSHYAPGSAARRTHRDGNTDGASSDGYLTDESGDDAPTPSIHGGFGGSLRQQRLEMQRGGWGEYYGRKRGDDDSDDFDYYHDNSPYRDEDLYHHAHHPRKRMPSILSKRRPPMSEGDRNNLAAVSTPVPLPDDSAAEELKNPGVPDDKTLKGSLSMLTPRILEYNDDEDDNGEDMNLVQRHPQSKEFASTGVHQSDARDINGRVRNGSTSQAKHPGRKAWEETTVGLNDELYADDVTGSSSDHSSSAQTPNGYPQSVTPEPFVPEAGSFPRESSLTFPSNSSASSVTVSSAAPPSTSSAPSASFSSSSDAALDPVTLTHEDLAGNTAKATGAQLHRDPQAFVAAGTLVIDEAPRGATSFLLPSVETLRSEGKKLSWSGTTSSGTASSVDSDSATGGQGTGTPATPTSTQIPATGSGNALHRFHSSRDNSSNVPSSFSATPNSNHANGAGNLSLAQKARADWQQTLSLALSGDAIRHEKKRLSSVSLAAAGIGGTLARKIVVPDAYDQGFLGQAFHTTRMHQSHYDRDEGGFALDDNDLANNEANFQNESRLPGRSSDLSSDRMQSSDASAKQEGHASAANPQGISGITFVLQKQPSASHSKKRTRSMSGSNFLEQPFFFAGLEGSHNRFNSEPVFAGHAGVGGDSSPIRAVTHQGHHHSRVHHGSHHHYNQHSHYYNQQQQQQQKQQQQNTNQHASSGHRNRNSVPDDFFESSWYQYSEREKERPRDRGRDRDRDRDSGRRRSSQYHPASASAAGDHGDGGWMASSHASFYSTSSHRSRSSHRQHGAGHHDGFATPFTFNLQTPPSSTVFLMWLEIRAKLHRRDLVAEHENLISGRRKFLGARPSLDSSPLLVDILNFKVNPESDSPACTAAQRVSDLLGRVEKFESLYPSRRALFHEVPIFFDPEIQKRLDLIISWSNMTHFLGQALKGLLEWTGCASLDIGERRRKRIENSTPSNDASEDLLRASETVQKYVETFQDRDAASPKDSPLSLQGDGSALPPSSSQRELGTAAVASASADDMISDGQGTASLLRAGKVSNIGGGADAGQSLHPLSAPASAVSSQEYLHASRSDSLSPMSSSFFVDNNRRSLMAGNSSVHATVAAGASSPSPYASAPVTTHASGMRLAVGESYFGSGGSTGGPGFGAANYGAIVDIADEADRKAFDQFSSSRDRLSSADRKEGHDVKDEDDSALLIAADQLGVKRSSQGPPSFIERVLKESGVKRCFEKSLLQGLNAVLNKARTSLAENRAGFSVLGLPPYTEPLQKLARFPGKLMEGFLKLRLEYADTWLLREPSLAMVDQLIEDFRISLGLAIQVKVRYVELQLPDENEVVVTIGNRVSDVQTSNVGNLHGYPNTTSSPGNGVNLTSPTATQQPVNGGAYFSSWGVVTDIDAGGFSPAGKHNSVAAPLTDFQDGSASAGDQAIPAEGARLPTYFSEGSAVARSGTSAVGNMDNGISDSTSNNSSSNNNISINGNTGNIAGTLGYNISNGAGHSYGNNNIGANADGVNKLASYGAGAVATPRYHRGVRRSGSGAPSSPLPYSGAEVDGKRNSLHLNEMATLDRARFAESLQNHQPPAMECCGDVLISSATPSATSDASRLEAKSHESMANTSTGSGVERNQRTVGAAVKKKATFAENHLIDSLAMETLSDDSNNQQTHRNHQLRHLRNHPLQKDLLGRSTSDPSSLRSSPIPMMSRSSAVSSESAAEASSNAAESARPFRLHVDHPTADAHDASMPAISLTSVDKLRPSQGQLPSSRDANQSNTDASKDAIVSSMEGSTDTNQSNTDPSTFEVVADESKSLSSTAGAKSPVVTSADESDKQNYHSSGPENNSHLTVIRNKPVLSRAPTAGEDKVGGVASLGAAYDCILLNSLRFYFKLLSLKLEAGAKAAAYFREAEMLESEWMFLSQIQRGICGGDIVTAIQFCLLAERLIKRVHNSLRRGMRHPADASASALVKRYHRVLEHVRLRSRRLLRFFKFISAEFENSTDFSVNMPLPEILAMLQTSGHFLVLPRDAQSQQTWWEEEGDAGWHADTLKSFSNCAEFNERPRHGDDSGAEDHGGGSGSQHSNINHRHHQQQQQQPQNSASNNNAGNRENDPRSSSRIFGPRGEHSEQTPGHSAGKGSELRRFYLLANRNLRGHPNFVRKLLRSCFTTKTEEPTGNAVSDEIIENGYILILALPADTPFVWKGSLMRMSRRSEAESILVEQILAKQAAERVAEENEQTDLAAGPGTFFGPGSAAPRPSSVPYAAPLELPGHRKIVSAAACDFLVDRRFSASGGGSNSNNDNNGAQGPSEDGSSGSKYGGSYQWQRPNGGLAHEIPDCLADDRYNFSDIPPMHLRMVADNASRLQTSKKMFRRFLPQNFQVMPHSDQRPHLIQVHRGLSRIKRGLYNLASRIVEAVAAIRAQTTSAKDVDLVENCFSFASDFGARVAKYLGATDTALPGLARTLVQLSIDWVSFTCSDCAIEDKRTFRWAVMAMEFVASITKGNNIMALSEKEFSLLRNKVACCMTLLVTHLQRLEENAREEACSNSPSAVFGSADTDISGLSHAASTATAATAASTPSMTLVQQGAEPSSAPSSSSHSASSSSSSSSSSANAPSSESISTVNAGSATSGAEGPKPHKTLEEDDSLDNGFENSRHDDWFQATRNIDAVRDERMREHKVIGQVCEDVVAFRKDTAGRTKGNEAFTGFYASAAASGLPMRWQQGRFLGGGSYGDVFIAINLDTGELMAVKEVKLKDAGSLVAVRKSIREEMAVMERLNHPNIIKYRGMEGHQDRVYIFMEYCSGGSIASLLEHGRVEDETVVRVYAQQMLRGLEYLHAHGIVHRDIKPDNVLLDASGVIKLVDFGASKTLRHKQTLAGDTNSLTGTPAYMAPEVITGDQVGRKADIWSLGCTILEMVTGRRPWSNLDNEWAIMYHIGISNKTPTLPDASQMSEVGIDFLRNCFRRDPEMRLSASELLRHQYVCNLPLLDKKAVGSQASTSLSSRAGTSQANRGADTRSFVSTENGSLVSTVSSLLSPVPSLV